MGIIKKAFSRPWRTLTEPLQDGFRVGKELKLRIKAIFIEMRSNRDPNADDAPDLTDFDAVLEHWQIAPEQVEPVIRGLKLRMILFGLMGFFGTINLIKGIFRSDLLYLISGTALVALGITAWVTSTWRISVLRNKKFIPFKKWIFRKEG